jgi:hypothetical protein
MTICPQCGYERTNNDDSFVSSEECPKCGVLYNKCKPPTLSKSIEPIIKNSETLDVKTEKVTTQKTEIIRLNNLKHEARKSAILIGLGVLSIAFNFCDFTYIYESGSALLLEIMIGGFLNVLGVCLILNGTVIGLRANYRLRKLRESWDFESSDVEMMIMQRKLREGSGFEWVSIIFLPFVIIIIFIILVAITSNRP